MPRDEVLAGNGAQRSHHAADRGHHPCPLPAARCNLHRDVHRRRQHHDISGNERRYPLVRRVARIVDEGIEIGHVPSARAQCDADRAADEAEAGDQRAARSGHQRDIRMSVRSTVCDVETSKYGRCTVTRGRLDFAEISAALYLPTAFEASIFRFICSATGTTAFTSVAMSPLRKYAGGLAALRLFVASGATVL